MFCMRSPTLRIVQALAICVLQRDREGTIQGLRMVLTLCDDHEAEQVVRQLENNLGPQERFWFGSILGARKSLQGAAAA